MADIVKFTAGLEADLLKKSGTSYVHALDTGHLYFVTKEDEDGNVFGSIYYDKGETNEKDRVFMGGAISQRAVADETGKNISEYYITRISSSADAVDTKLTTYNGLGKSLETITLPVANASQSGVVIAGNQTFAGRKTFNDGIAFPNSDNSVTPGLYWVAGTNDGARIVSGATAQNAGYLEIAVKDDGNEPIYVRQYTGDFANIARTLTLLNANGNTVFPGTLLPTGTKAQDLGSESLYWKTAYIDTVNANELTGHLTGSLSGPVTGNATSADKWYTTRKFTIGSTTKDVNGESDVSWSRTEIGCSKHFTSFKTSASGGFGWYTIATISDNSTSPAVFFVRGYAHSSVIFTATKGYETSGSINILDYCGSRNDDYAYINGVRLLSDGRVQIRIRSKKGSNSAQDTNVNLSINVMNSRDNLTLEDALVVDTSNATAIQTRELNLSESGLMYANKFIGYLSGTANMAENDAGGASIIPKYITRVDYDATSNEEKTWIRTYDGNNSKKAEVEMPIASTTSNGLVNRTAQTFKGVKTFNDQVIFAYANDAAKDTASSGNIIIGNPNGQHIAIDDNEIMAKTTNGKTLSTLYLNNEGGPVQIGGNLTASGHNTLTLGTDGVRWNNIFGVLGTFLNLDVEDTLYVNKKNVGTAGGVSLRGAEGPMVSGIALRTTATPGTHGYATGSWATYLTSKAGFGWIFRDSDNSKNIASLSTNGRLALNDIAQTPGIGAPDTYIAYPSGGKFTCQTAKITGYLKITLPQSWTSTMMRFKVSIYNYVKGTSVEYLIGGYNYSDSPTWQHQPFAQCIGKWEHPQLSNLTVRFGHDGTKCAIYIGDANTVWDYPQVTVSDVTLGYRNYDFDKWASGWTVGFTSALGAITATIENTNIAYRAYHADRATEDESGANIRANYLARIRQYESTGTTFKFTGVNKNGSDMDDLISIPEANASTAGLVTTNAQTWAGEKTFNAGIRFPNVSTGLTSGINWTMGDNDQARIVAGATASNGGYLEIATSDDGNEPIYVRQYGPGVFGTLKRTLTLLDANGDTIFPGNLNISGNIMPSADNTYVIGDNNTKWKDVYSDTSHVYKTLYVNSSGVVSEGGIGLYSVNAPESYGIAIRNNLGTHGYVTTPLSMFFSISNANTAGWIFRYNGTNVASINGQGYAQFNKINMDRSGGITNGRIGWYRTDFYTWYTYMSDRSNSTSSPTGAIPSLLGSVTTWAMRSLIENVGGYGWVWESCANSANATPVARMALSSVDGKLYLKNDINIITGDSDKFIHYVYKTKNNDGFTVDSSVNTVGASWRAGVTHSTADNEYTIQSGSAAETGTEWLNGLKIAQGTLNATFGTTNLGGLGVANTNSSTGHGISLYGGGVSGRPTYGLFFGGTGTFGKYGGVQGDWATYFTMDSTANRGWVFLKGETAVASINNDGITKLGDGSGATASSAGSDTGALRVVGGISTTKNSYFNEKITFPENKIALEFSSRDTWKAGIIYDTNGHEALVIAMQNPRTSFIVADNTDPNAWTGGTWPSKTPIIQAKKGALYINKLFNGDPSYNLHVEGTANITGNVTMGGTLEVTSTTKIKQGSAATAINTGALQVTGGLSTTAASYMNGALTVNSTINAAGNITAPRFIGLADRATFIDATIVGGSSATYLTTAPSAAGRVAFYYNFNPCTGLFPTSNNANFVITINKHSGNYDSQLGFSSDGNIYYRSFNGSALNNTTGWQLLLTTANAFGELDGRYVNVTGDTMTGMLRVNNAPIFGYRYGQSNNAPAFVFDKPGSNYTGIGANGSSDTIYFSAVTSDGNWNWNNDYKQKWIFNGSVAADAFNGNASSATIARSLGTDESMKLYAQYSNELNFGGTNNSDTIYFGYRAADSKPIPTQFVFGGPSGSATLVAANLSGNASSASKLNVLRTIGGSDHATALKTEFNSYKSSIPRNCLATYYSTAYGNGSFYMGYFLSGYDSNPYGGFFVAHYSTPYYVGITSGSFVQSQLWKKGDAVTGAVWNDYAECRESKVQEAGYVLCETGKDNLVKTIERLQHFAGVSSDTWGFSQGETEKAKTHIAVAGRVLVYPYQDRNNYKPGDCVCAAPGGKVDIMTREEIINYPDRIVGTVSCVPEYDTWGGGENADRDPVKINGRIWIKVR